MYRRAPLHHQLLYWVRLHSHHILFLLTAHTCIQQQPLNLLVGVERRHLLLVPDNSLFFQRQKARARLTPQKVTATLHAAGESLGLLYLRFFGLLRGVGDHVLHRIYAVVGCDLVRLLGFLPQGPAHDHRVTLDLLRCQWLHDVQDLSQRPAL